MTNPAQQAEKDSGAARSAVLEARDIGHSYGGRRALECVSLTLFPGELVGLLGPNGAGKTTCMRLITGLLAAGEGSITLNGKDITRLPMEKRARMGLGYLPQEPSIFRRLSVRDNLVLVLEENGVRKTEREPWIDGLLSRFRLTGLADKKGDALSGGERRRVEIARSLALKPKVILFDEPFTGIDPISIKTLQEHLLALARDGISLLVTDHNVRETLKICHRATILDGGKTLCSGKPQEISRNVLAKERYLGDDFHLDS